MMDLLQLLNKDFRNSSFDELKESFIKTYGVAVKQFENKYIFKYDTILANYNRSITHECRGVILYFIDGEWSYHSRVFDKFFNLDEGKHQWSSESYLEKHLPHIRLMEKKDGSCIQVSYDREHDNFLASTLGSIQTESVFDEPYTFSDLFWKLFNNAFNFKKDRTYIFEMWSRANQVVTDYGIEHLTLTAIRMLDGSYVPMKDLENIIKDTNIRRPFFIDKVFSSRDELISFVESESKNEEKYGKNPEGFVGYDILSMTPVFKLKNEKYCQYHRINSGDKRYITKNLAIALFEGNIDDIFPDLTDTNKEYVERVKEYLINLQETIDKIVPVLSNLHDKKAYALEVNAQITKYGIVKYSAFFFDMFGHITVMKEKPSILNWFKNKKHYSRYMSLIKDL